MIEGTQEPQAREAESERRIASVVETLVNQIAHDVRNHAFTIGLQAELGERRAEAMPEVKGHFSAVLRQVDALKIYLERLLLYGRPAVVRPGAVDPAAFVRQQVQAVQFGWRPDAPPLAISVEAAGDLGTVRWDVSALGHAVRSVIDNAVRSADPSPPVGVRLARNGGTVVIEVADSGTGIAPDALELVWSPMRVRRHGGAGLGLAIARKMVAAHGGRIAIASGPQGTTVTIELPAEAAAV